MIKTKGKSTRGAKRTRMLETLGYKLDCDTTNRILSFIPEELKQALTGRQLGLIMKAIYESGDVTDTSKYTITSGNITKPAGLTDAETEEYEEAIMKIENDYDRFRHYNNFDASVLVNHTNRFCFRCGCELAFENELDYPYVCVECDENMFSFESCSRDKR
ncbi:hypothetical protein SAMN02745136_00418 [Anaerocolumna jejuensis DSM 15929]|uniref:Uncharacterized protein n=1 Tax=Anaerocolumna jejuensis DSM 15929 TaxID=1121322 RepID=A0A1M6KDX6_9FIRM|nr:hypothetical protein [Anaerocolumna jejuensis]SHJ57151.1 hypothetical protein SAMN02745136_00418 [Anaerocolumna jejuensis DSM 15929]